MNHPDLPEADCKIIEGFPMYAVSRNGNVWSNHHNKWKRLRFHITRGHYRVALQNDGVRKDAWVHHLVLQAFIGPHPKGMEGCHEDGDPSNNNLDNLRWDTHPNNIQDRRKYGNYPEGVQHPRARLTNAQIREIRIAAKNGTPIYKLAITFNVTDGHISNIVHHRLWKHIKEIQPLRKYYVRGESQPTSKLTERDVKKIKELLNIGKQHKEIAQMFNVSRSNIGAIANGVTWKHI